VPAQRRRSKSCCSGSWWFLGKSPGGEVPPVTGKTPRFCRLGSLLRRRKKPAISPGSNGGFVRMALLSRSPAGSKLAYFGRCARQKSTMSQFGWLRRLGPGFLGSPPIDRGIVGLGILARLLFWGRRLAWLGLAVCLRAPARARPFLAPSSVGLGSPPLAACFRLPCPAPPCPWRQASEWHYQCIDHHAGLRVPGAEAQRQAVAVVEELDARSFVGSRSAMARSVSARIFGSRGR